MTNGCQVPHIHSQHLYLKHCQTAFISDVHLWNTAVDFRVWTRTELFQEIFSLFLMFWVSRELKRSMTFNWNGFWWISTGLPHRSAWPWVIYLSQMQSLRRIQTWRCLYSFVPSQVTAKCSWRGSHSLEGLLEQIREVQCKNVKTYLCVCRMPWNTLQRHSLTAAIMHPHLGAPKWCLCFLLMARLFYNDSVCDYFSMRTSW